MLFSTLPPSSFADGRIGVFAGADWKSFSGDFDLEPGWGLNVGVSLPYSRNLELFAVFVPPLKYRVDTPGGQIFSLTGYEKSYSRLSSYSVSAGFALLGQFKTGQKIVPCLNLKFGKTWLQGSSKDRFSGINTDFGVGLRYHFSEKLAAELSYSWTTIDFTREKINGKSRDTAGNVKEKIETWGFSIVYSIRFSKSSGDFASRFYNE